MHHFVRDVDLKYLLLQCKRRKRTDKKDSLKGRSWTLDLDRREVLRKTGTGMRDRGRHNEFDYASALMKKLKLVWDITITWNMPHTLSSASR